MTDRERISPDDLECWLEVRHQLEMADAIRQFYTGYLARRYRLGPQDVIQQDGTIVRPSVPVETAC